MLSNKSVVLRGSWKPKSIPAAIIILEKLDPTGLSLFKKHVAVTQV